MNLVPNDLATKPAGPNRATRRALDKGLRCLKVGAQIPHRLSQKLGIQIPGALNRLAEKRGLTITPGGSVRRAIPDGTATA